ncbi:MAG: hypothetical protein OXU69_10995 [Gemmatimonadota bacterium]|nr:hypothetical protein [Gemmatimonadota bacterium]MDE2985222.1 hypothetical protein [Gemmatimonadota bacterium]
MRRVAAFMCVVATPLVVSPPFQPPLPAAQDLLWLAVVEGSGNLYPIARLAEESWDVPDWLDPFEMEALEEGEGVALTTDGDGNLRWSGGLVASGVPTDWLFHSERHTGFPVTTDGGRPTAAHCTFKWALIIDGSSLDLPGQHRFEGVALSRAPEATFVEDDFPGLDRIREELDLVDSPPGRWGMSYRKFRWLGFFRVKGAVIGIVHGEYYEGEIVRVVEIDGEVGRVLTRTHMGGC